MKKSCYKENIKGFTLIEMLVVVLIIGILAAIALPQYQKAVTNAKFANIEVFLRQAARQWELAYTTNGTFPAKWKEVDIETSVCTGWNGNLLTCTINDVTMQIRLDNGFFFIYDILGARLVYYSKNSTDEHAGEWKCLFRAPFCKRFCGENVTSTCYFK